VESTPGKGSRFHVNLPWGQTTSEQVTLPEGAAAPSDTAATTPAGDTHILLVEDNELNTAMFSSYLERCGYQVSIAREGAEAVAKSIELLPDIVLMDIQMPGMDGLEATRRIRRIPEMQHRPIIAVTALAMPGDRERCLEAGADAYLSKPVGMKELNQTIRSWLART
jgi:CheY-like chemotaxis protein